MLLKLQKKFNLKIPIKGSGNEFERIVKLNKPTQSL
jgi:hypothetical protein